MHKFVGVLDKLSMPFTVEESHATEDINWW